eukprot:TRINITY_DN6198_c0_g2_i1.p1 TRINITY_DN6198_c0_g2~~TRINITY_DN6198_c0_g2_i1.p1  ORF type:complete len:944 (-),score=352.96 TRINITY_DN6198_c0_g2_i1:24-2855(-)
MCIRDRHSTAPDESCAGCAECQRQQSLNNKSPTDTLDYSRFDNIYDSDDFIDSEDCESTVTDEFDEEDFDDLEDESPTEVTSNMALDANTTEATQGGCHWGGSKQSCAGSARDVLDYSRFDIIDDSEEEDSTLTAAGETCNCAKCQEATLEEDRRAARELEVREKVQAEKARLKAIEAEAQDKAKRKAEAKARKKQAQEGERARVKAEEEALLLQRAVEEKARRHAVEQERMRRKAVEEEAKKKRVEEERARKKLAEEEKQARRLAEEEKKRIKAEQKEQRRKVEEEDRARKRALEEEARQKRAIEEQQKREKAEQDRARKKALKAEKKAAEEAKRKEEMEAAVQQERLRVAALEASRKAAEEAEAAEKQRQEQQASLLSPEVQAAESELLLEIVGWNKPKSKKGRNKTKELKGPLPGFLFFCNTSTYQECVDRLLFGLPASVFGQLSQIVPVGDANPATLLFLLNFETRDVHGIYVANQPAAMNIQPDAWTGIHPPGYPAQVSVSCLKQCTAPVGKSDGFGVGQLAAGALEELLARVGSSWAEVQRLMQATLHPEPQHTEQHTTGRQHAEQQRAPLSSSSTLPEEEDKARLAREIKESLRVQSFETEMHREQWGPPAQHYWQAPEEQYPGQHFDAMPASPDPAFLETEDLDDEALLNEAFSVPSVQVSAPASPQPEYSPAAPLHHSTWSGSPEHDDADELLSFVNKSVREDLGGHMQAAPAATSSLGGWGGFGTQEQRSSLSWGDTPFAQQEHSNSSSLNNPNPWDSSHSPQFNDGFHLNQLPQPTQQPTDAHPWEQPTPSGGGWTQPTNSWTPPAAHQQWSPDEFEQPRSAPAGFTEPGYNMHPSNSQPWSSSFAQPQPSGGWADSYTAPGPANAWQHRSGSSPDSNAGCILCHNAPRDAGLFPCGHQSTCVACAKLLQQSQDPCPICRSQIQGHTLIYNH